ncbi:ribonuclease H-like domain-containing protein [Armillaria novae-zelandiae]|uniref:poly(A)-specific ribonuclease n=1 Tax=Armillaria novae-zelandiae TaxID=153914 RepID=A0AA39PQ05_9AGAR|nr:ribonuclease H-like domain-containing protein [Armillaria novae-zelandiae]
MSRIREVWAPNLEAEMHSIREIIENYPYIAMDTEFPGVVARPIGSFKTSSDYHYQTMRCNVDLLKIIQVGITFADEDGNLPPETSTWQFNFRFSVNDDMYAPDSIELLQKSGLDFQRHEEIGISPQDFAELMITSGMVLAPDTRWVSFHSGYDFGYFVKLLTAVSLPKTEEEFFDILRIWFPTVYDIKFMMRACKVLRGGLQDVADDLGVVRIGNSHTAGSDSLLTASTFFKMRQLYFNDTIDDKEYSGKLYGFGQTFPLTNGLTDPGRGGATIAEREDRGTLASRDPHAQTPGQIAAGIAQTPVGMGIPMSIPTPLPNGAYGPLSANGPYMRTSLVGGGR